MRMRVEAEFGIKFQIKLEIEFATKLPGQQAGGITPASYDTWGFRCLCLRQPPPGVCRDRRPGVGGLDLPRRPPAFYVTKPGVLVLSCAETQVVAYAGSGTITRLSVLL
jgi:hypothetical protein